jgi:hypothetical protein
MGRKTKYKHEFCQFAIDFMAKGYSKMALAAKLGINRDTLYEWARVNKDFSDSIKKGEAKSLYFWEKIGIKGMSGKIKGFNPAVWIFVMKNRFQYRDNPQDLEPIEDVTRESLATIAKKYLKELEILDNIDKANPN